MNMEASHMVLPLRLSRSLFFVTICLSCLAFHCNGLCEVFKCGNYSLDYPFGTNGGGCGHPSLQVECEIATMKPLITIGGYQYYILEPHNYTQLVPNSNPAMSVLYKPLQQDACHVSEGIYDQFLNATDFRIGEGYIDMILGANCTFPHDMPGYLSCEDRYHNLSLPDLKKYCGLVFTLPVKEIDLEKPLPQFVDEGINITWNTTEYCENCKSDYRNCAHLDTSSFCYCSSTSYSQQCSRIMTANPVGKRNKTATGKSNKFAIIFGAAIGSGVLFIAALLLVVFYRKRSSASKELQLRTAIEPTLKKVEQFLDDYAHEMPSRYSYSQLKKITNNFADKLGQGGFGKVYKGKLPRGNLVAVKILNQPTHIETQFMNEVATIGSLHHVHLVRLMGFCFDRFRSALVYEYMVNGSLEKFIFAGEKKEITLNGEQLYSIALGTARGIAYLHQDCQRRIIHFDIKPHNILLDKDFRPKIADFGLAKLCGREDDHISMTVARGTPGYIAPEVWNRNLGSVTDKSDVYSFGMLLLEIAGGRKNFDVHASGSSQLYFPEQAFKWMQNGQLEMMLRGRGEEEIKWEDEEKARRLVKIGLWCIQYNSTDRPRMSRVVQMLEGNGDDVSNPPLPFNEAASSFSSTV